MPADTPDNPAQRHEDRAQKSADALRAMLTALGTAGMGAALVALHDQRTCLRWLSAWAFAFSLACVLVSWFYVKHRELRRRDAARTGMPDPVFLKRQRSWTWDRWGGALLALGAVLLLFGFKP